MVDIMLPLITCIFVVFDLASGGVAACANPRVEILRNEERIVS